MALPEERSEQYRRKWRSRLTRERQKLSASVETTLDVSQEHLWQYEEDEQEYSIYTVQGESLIPPRLSLQSKPMPAVRPAHSDSPIIAPSHMDVGAAIEADSSQKTILKTQNAGMLKRFFQRLTSSLPVVRRADHAATFPTPPDSEESQYPARSCGAVLLPPTTAAELLLSGQDIDDLFVGKVEQVTPMPSSLAISLPPVPATLPAEPTLSPPGKQQQLLAGRATKIRLESAKIPATPKPQSSAPQKVPATDISKQDVGTWFTAPAAASLTVSALDEETDSHGHHLSAVDAFGSAMGTTSTPFPIAFNSELGSAGRVPLSGSGVFEVGQRDLSVSNKLVTASSVVLVTLTSNPGPVVLQYVSLQPRSGFTLHLTAPAVEKTTFNYVILLGEL